MNPNWIWSILAAAVLIFGSFPHGREHADKSAERLALDTRKARLDKVWPVPQPADNEAERFWSARNGYLTLWEPDETAPPQVDGRPLFSMHCDEKRGLVVNSGIIIGMDLPLSLPPYDIMVLEGGGLRYNARLIAGGDGFTTFADADFNLPKSAIRRVLSAPYFVVRPLYLGRPQPYYVMEDIGERHSAPPTALVNAFLADCSLPAQT